jgi:ABC-type dipeptide/oligopeptide/nickel transport system permease component
LVQYTVRRLLQAIIVLFGVTIVTFSVNFLAGDPTYTLLGDVRGMTQEQIDAFRHKMGFDRPVVVQYGDWLWKAVRGDLGSSLRYKEANITVIRERLPATLQLAGAALACSLIIAIPLGVVAATNRNSFWDGFSMVLALVGQSIPSFWLGLMLMMIFAVYFRLLPVSGRGGIENMVLPTITMSVYSIALNTRMVRSSMLEVLGQDYVRTARAKGLRERMVLVQHALRNALIPVVTLIGMSFGGLLGGALIVESIFAWPGMGQLTIMAIYGKDLPLLQACVTLFAVTFVLANLIVDFAYVYLDPRVRLR